MPRLKVGDLAYIAFPQPCCGVNHSYGLVAIIEDIRMVPQIECVECGRIVNQVTKVAYFRDRWIYASRLRRFLSLNELEQTQRLLEDKRKGESK